MVRARLLTLTVLLGLLAPVLVAPRPTTAQEAGAGLTTAIYAGACGDVGGEPAATLTPPGLPPIEAVGAREARPVATSFSTVPLALEVLLAEEHVIATNASEDQERAACGAIGGVRTEAGAIVIELSEQGDSGLSGVAYLAPSGAGAGQTDISLFLAGLEPAPPETAEPTPEPTTEADQDTADEATTEGGELPTEVTVSITSAGFDPDPVTIPVGGTVTWVNDDTGVGHAVTVLSDAGVEVTSDPLLPGFGSFSHTFTAPGTYPYVDVSNNAIQGTIIVETAAASTTETTAEVSQDASGPTETYVSPTYGFSLAYDPTVWEVVDGPSSEGGVDFIALNNGFTRVEVGGTTGIPDAQVCVQFMTDNQTSQPDITAFEPLLDESGAPVAGGDPSDAFAATRFTDDGGTSDVAYIRCLVLPSGDAVLIIGQFATEAFYDTAAEQREQLLEGLALP